MEGSANMRVLIGLGVITLFGIITFALAAATLGTLNQRYNHLNEQLNHLKEQVADIPNKLFTTTEMTVFDNETVS
ncbi:hypothetical protein I4U23_013577 [Adineta vaga]|nr:hypothetical protein I4U23_013577 [Adineta vaga]